MLLSVSEFQQHKKLSPTRNEVVLHTRKGKLHQTSEMTMLASYIKLKFTIISHYSSPSRRMFWVQ